MFSLCRRFIRDDSGQSTIEFAILALSMAMIAMSLVVSVGTKIKDIYTTMLSQLGG
jgi:Flp pilus assembly pilin Flp